MNPLSDCGLPRFFAVRGDVAARCPAPEPGGGQAVRFYGRLLSGMQKEAIVCSSAGGVWRLASDEGAYLSGLDEAPCPLAFMTTGMAASFIDAIQAGLAAARVDHEGIRLTQDNYYTMHGSMPQRTMIGGAMPVELDVEIAVARDADDLTEIVTGAVAAAPVSGLICKTLTNTFTLTVNGREVVPAVSPSMNRPPLPDPRSLFEGVAPGAALPEPLVARGGMSPRTDEATSHAGSSYAPEQHRTLHLRGICTVRPDGLKVIEQHVYNPHGSIFQLLSEEAPANGGRGRAPDANTYISAGIGFCFMTQFGRFAKIIGKQLDGYRIVQDTRFAPGHADPVETHTYLDTPEDDAFARELLDMGERTCFLHALCRTEVATNVRVHTQRVPV
ncbi:MAG: OsmC family protein [Vicinamibacterales bacterium]